MLLHRDSFPGDKRLAAVYEMYASVFKSRAQMTSKTEVMDVEIVFLATVSGYWWRLLARGWG